MVRFLRWTVAIVLASIFSISVAHAGVSFQPPTPEELNLKSEPMAPGAPAIILFRQVDRDDNGRTSHEDNYLRVKILTEEGRKYANVEIPFWNKQTHVTALRARTIRPDGSVVEFGGQSFDKELVKARGIKYLAKTFTLPEVEVGSIIEYSYTLDFSEYMLFDSHWILSNELFTKKAHFSLKPYQGNGYNNFTLRWSWNQLPAGALPKQEADRVVRMDAQNIPAFVIEDYMPPENELKSRVDFIYEPGFGEKEVNGYWKKIGKTRNEQLESFIGKRKTMEQAVSQIVSPSDPPELKLRKIYDRVQQIRNISYQLEKTQQEEKRDKEKLGDNVEDVWRRGYGTGDQLTWLYLGLVRAAGFEAYGCWVSERADYFFNKATMESAKLNANVVVVRLNGKDLYLDPGAMFTPFGLLPWSETAVAGLRLDKDGGTWIVTPLPEAAESRVERVGKMKLLEDGDLEGTVTVSYVGLDAMYHRLTERHADDVERKKDLEESLMSQLTSASQAELTNKPDWNGSETPLVAEFSFKIPGWASSAGRRVLLPGAVFVAGEKGVFEHASRVQPIYFEYPYQKIDDLTITLPPGWQVSSVPKPQDINAKAIVYSAKVEQGAESLRLTRKFTIDVLLIEQKNYPALRNFYQAVRTSDAVQVVVQPGEIHAKN